MILERSRRIPQSCFQPVAIDATFDRDDLMPLGERPLAEVGAEKARSAGDDGSAHERAPAARAGPATAWGRASGIPSGRPIET